MTQRTSRDNGTESEPTIDATMSFGGILGLLTGFVTTYNVLYTVFIGTLYGFFVGVLLAEARNRLQYN